ncbi:MAG: MFS transporter [Candidatus Brocadiia bacterium]
MRFSPVSYLRGLFRSHEHGDLAVLAEHTFRMQVVCAALEGAAVGIIAYAAYVLKRDLNASDMVVALVGLSVSFGQLFSYPVGYFFEGRDKRPLFRAAVVLVLLAAVGFAVFEPGSIFLLWLMLAFLAAAIVTPARTSLYQSNYVPRERSRFLASVGVFAALLNIAATFVGGLFLNHNPSLVRVLFPFALVLWAASFYIYSKIPARPLRYGQVRTFTIRTCMSPFTFLVRQLRRDKYFLTFEVAFFLYGLGFMTSNAVLPMLYAEQFNASNMQFGITNTILNMAMVFGPLFGAVADRSTPTRVAAVSFLCLSLYPLMYLASPSIGYGYMAHIWYSFSMIGVMITWSIGPIFFSGGRDASLYTGMHATLTGVRAMIAYPFAGWLKEATHSVNLVFCVSSLLFLAGFLVMRSLHVRAVKVGHFVSTPSGRLEVIAEEAETPTK